MASVIGWKLFHQRRDGTLGPLFINKRLRIPVGKVMKAELHPTSGYAVRQGWHATLRPIAPHLRTTGDRVWRKVKLYGAKRYSRPKSQGGTWLLADKLMVLDG